ncbi:uncharacterized protein STEHIDRAFT_135530 [Stereum hirsutum FP-91666 SS1]|uniref:DUF6534 domain-containing protein n=1 Tax=Stereum hirsutum (strain FP-91666) TaxID=721885 RepID=R7RYC4_STEHR|nr:uncharacterized protein STEHIDRAFT_135530 [Stereum hirsutum FP-91666 SS1]EIM79900.1 hypothetical protein STEHIDRAFT_135530 [Stereum hirsutum FP-91666 SS1]
MTLLARAQALRPRGTMSTLNKLILYVLCTGLLTTVVAFIILIIFLVSGGLQFIGVFLNLSKLYSNSLLAMLNNRATRRRNSDQQLAMPADLSLRTVEFSWLRASATSLGPVDFEGCPEHGHIVTRQDSVLDPMRALTELPRARVEQGDMSQA